MARILVVEDDEALSRLLLTNLRFEGFEVAAARDGREGLEAQLRRPADLIILDLMLPGLDGFQVLQQLRERGEGVAVIVLTCRRRELDRVRGLSMGADDYMVKPFSVLELMARVRAILRRTRPSEPPSTSRSGPFQLDHLKLRAFKQGECLPLTPREFLLLAVFFRHSGVTLSREDLLDAAWEAEARPSARTVDVHIARLRRKLGMEGDDPIATVGGEGYRWTLTSEGSSS